MRSRSSLPLYLIQRVALALLTVIVAIAASVTIGVLALDLTSNEIAKLLQVLISSAVLSLGVCGLALWLSSHQRWSRVGPRLTITIAIGLVLLVINSILGAVALFTTGRDVAIAALLTGYGALVTTVFAGLAASHVGDGQRAVARAAQLLASGDLAIRVPHKGDRELAAIGEAFNLMAAQIDHDVQLHREHDAAWQGLLASAGNDLRGPVSSLRVMVDAATSGQTDPDAVLRLVRAIERDTLSLGKVIDDLAEIARLDAGPVPLRLENCLLGDLIVQVLDALNPLAQRQRVSLHANVDRAAWPIFADAERLHRALYSIVEHAIGRTRADGAVVLEALDRGSDLQVNVHDMGGAHHPDVPRAFGGMGIGELPRTASGGADGGLGMLIARRLIEANGGRIWAAPSPDGSMVTSFTVPKASRY